MKVHFIAQSGFIVQYLNKRIAIAVWTNNLVNPVTLDEAPKIDHVFVAHDQGDHDLKFAMEIGKRDNAIFYTGYELRTMLLKSVQKWESANVGGLCRSGEIEGLLTHAEHLQYTGIPENPFSNSLSARNNYLSKSADVLALFLQLLLPGLAITFTNTFRVFPARGWLPSRVTLSFVREVTVNSFPSAFSIPSLPAILHPVAIRCY
jgi:hypothetical protein